MSRKKIIVSDPRILDHFGWDDIVKTVKDVTKIASAPVIVVGQKIANKPVDLKLETSTFKRAEQSGVGKAAQDTVRLGMAPITNAISSVKNQKIDNGYQTKTGKIVGKLHDSGNVGINVVAKSFADTISGGLVSKGKNWLAEKIDPKGKLGYQQQAKYKYGEMSGAPNSGVKVLDKTLSYVPVASAAVGTVAAVYSGGTGLGALAPVIGGAIASKIPNKDRSNIKPTNVSIGSNVLNDQQPIVTDAPMTRINNGLPNNTPKGVQPGDIPGTLQTDNALASFGSFDFTNPWMIGGVIVLVILMLSVSKSTSNA